MAAMENYLWSKGDRTVFRSRRVAGGGRKAEVRKVFLPKS